MAWMFVVISVMLVVRLILFIRNQEKQFKARRLELLEKIDNVSNQNMALRRVLDHHNIEIKF
jgi:energy-converting hydrogenase Eha subunit H